ncbi:MAG: hypothetical protein FWD48_06785 [Oscillospiraceae bacterium]|nr:hypothetical protein [Oscillospiraceae bacterium]
MQFDKTIRENQHGKYIEIRVVNFDEGIEFALQNKIPSIHLGNTYTYDIINNGVDKNLPVDFKKLELLSPYLRIIFIQDTLANVINPESIYSLKNLERIHTEKQKFALDLSKFDRLSHFGGAYWKKLSFEKAYSLKSMVLRRFPEVNLVNLSELKHLEILHVYHSKMQSLEGIQNLPLRYLHLTSNNLLNDIEALRELKELELLCVDKCKMIMEYELLQEMKCKIDVRIINIRD